MDVLCPCGTTFTTESRRAKYCSTRCRTRAHRGWTADRFLAPGPTECADCGAVIEPRRGSLGRPRKCCASCRPSRSPSQPKLPTPCDQCPNLTLRKYCSQRCIDAAKRVPCAGCGEPIYLGRSSRPPGQATCRSCRRAGRTAEQMAEAQRARVRAANMSPCADCGAPSFGVRCRCCADTLRRDGRPAGDATARKLLDARRADRDKLAPGIYTPYKRQQLRDKWKRQGKTCLYCGTTPVQAVDHVIPLALGGTNHEGNLAPACHECNRLKQDNLLSAWRYGIKVHRWRVPVPPRMPSARRKRVVGEQTVLNVCPICSAMYTRRRRYCSDDCMWEANARAARDRSRAARGLPVDREAPTKPTKRVRRAA